MMRWIIIIPLMVVFMAACTKKSHVGNNKDVKSEPKSAEVQTDDIDFDVLSKEMCDCTLGMFKDLEKLKQLSEAGDAEEITKLSTEIEGKLKTFEACIDQLEAKYPSLDGNPENEAKAEAALLKNCPELAKAMGLPEE